MIHEQTMLRILIKDKLVLAVLDRNGPSLEWLQQRCGS